MTANKTYLTSLVFTCLLGLSLPVTAQASDIAPPLYGVQEIVVNMARLGNEPASANCGVLKRRVSDHTLTILKRNNLPAVTSIGKKVDDRSLISVELFPEIITLVPRNNLCLSWVALSVQSRNAINLPPATYHREVKLNYWKGGLLVSTSQHRHDSGVTEALDKLLSQFTRQYNTDQPPKL